MASGIDVVVLIPGFLGFDRFGGFRYFADRVSAALRGALQQRLHRPVPVVPVTTEPTATLGQRQERLLALLDRLDSRLDGKVARLHLVGHSSGGVDAWFLSCLRPLAHPTWGDIPHHKIRGKLASVTAIAAPHRGTCLVATPLADLFRHRALPRSFSELRLELRLCRDVALATSHTKLPVAEALVGAALSKREAIKFLWQVLRQQGLVNDLLHASMERRHDLIPPEHRPGQEIRRRSFVTMVLRDNACDPPDNSGPDRLFLDLYDATAAALGLPLDNGVKRASNRIGEALRHRGRVICSHDGIRQRLLRDFGDSVQAAAAVNDGIVTSALQLVDPESDSDELAGIVVGDHADVIGHYDRVDPYVDRVDGTPPLNAGLFHSGSQFGDDQFFALYDRVADEISCAVPT
jgi:hypothetical protein